MTHERRREAALRVRGLYPPLPEIFASLRTALGEAPPAAPPDTPEPSPPVEPDLPEPPVEAPPAPEPADPVAAALRAAARDASGDADDVAVSLVLAVEGPVSDAVQAGAESARAAGVPGDAPVPANRAMEAVLTVLMPYAAAVAAGDAEPPAGLADRIRAVARSAGVVEAVTGTPWSAVQRFGDPYCPRTACYGRNGSLLTEARVEHEGFPPYGDGCNCTAVPADLP